MLYVHIALETHFTKSVVIKMSDKFTKYKIGYSYAFTRKPSHYNYGKLKRKTNHKSFDESPKYNLTDNKLIRVQYALYLKYIY